MSALIIIGEGQMIWFIFLNDTGLSRLKSRGKDIFRMWLWSSRERWTFFQMPCEVHLFPWFLPDGQPLFPLCSLSCWSRSSPPFAPSLWNILYCYLSHISVTKSWASQERSSVLPLFFLRPCRYVPNQHVTGIMCGHHLQWGKQQQSMSARHIGDLDKPEHIA